MEACLLKQEHKEEQIFWLIETTLSKRGNRKMFIITKTEDVPFHETLIYQRINQDESWLHKEDEKW